MGMIIQCERELTFQEGKRIGYKVVSEHSEWCQTEGKYSKSYRTWYMYQHVPLGGWLVSNRCRKLEFVNGCLPTYEKAQGEVEYAIHVIDEPACALTFFRCARLSNYHAKLVEVCCREEDLVGAGYFTPHVLSTLRITSSTWFQVFVNRLISEEELVAKLQEAA